MSLVRTLTVDDDLALSRVGYERGEVLVPDTGSATLRRIRNRLRSRTDSGDRLVSSNR